MKVKELKFHPKLNRVFNEIYNSDEAKKFRIYLKEIYSKSLNSRIVDLNSIDDAFDWENNSFNAKYGIDNEFWLNIHQAEADDPSLIGYLKTYDMYEPYQKKVYKIKF